MTNEKERELYEKTAVEQKKKNSMFHTWDIFDIRDCNVYLFK